MRPTRFRILALFLAASAITVYGSQLPPWPAGVQKLHTADPNVDPIGKVVVLPDTNQDGVMDKRTVFADGLVLARAIKVLEHGVLVAEPPNLWLMHDTDGDLKMDT